MKVVVGISGASGIPYATKLLQELSKSCEIHLVVSDTAKSLLEMETSCTIEHLEQIVTMMYKNSDLSVQMCSGSFLFDAMVIVPCSMSTLSKLANGISDNTMTRAGSIALKERRKLIIVPRETPLSTIQIENMLKLSKSGAMILPAMPGFYNGVESVDDMVNFVVCRILDVLGIENDLCPRWK